MNTANPSQFDPHYVRPFAAAENQFLQVLVDRFQVLRKGHGFELQVGINDASPAIWLQETMIGGNSTSMSDFFTACHRKTEKELSWLN